MWKNIPEPDRPQMIIWRTHIAFCIPKATNRHSKNVTFLAFPLQQWLDERTSMLHCTYIACFVLQYRVIHKSLRDFRTRLRNNQDRHGIKEHINR